MRRGVHHLRVIARLLGYLYHGRDEAVQRLLGLRLGRLDHQRLVHNEREVHRGRVIALVNQALGDVQRLDARLVLDVLAGQHHLVHTHAVVGQPVRVFELCAYVVSVDDSVLAHVTQAAQPQVPYVGIRPHVHTEVAPEVLYPANRALGLHKRVLAVTLLDHRAGQERREVLFDGHRTAARTSPTMWSGEGLVQVD